MSPAPVLPSAIPASSSPTTTGTSDAAGGGQQRSQQPREDDQGELTEADHVRATIRVSQLLTEGAYPFGMFSFRTKSTIVDPADALPGRDRAMPVPSRHAVLGTPIQPPFPDGLEQAVFGMGCFWGAERVFWQAPGVYTTAVGYAGGYHAEPDATTRSAAARPATPRPCSSSSTRRRSPTRSCCASSGRTTTRPRVCARATTSARSTARRSTDHRRAARGRRGDRARSTPSGCARPATARSRRRSRRPASSTTPRTTTSSTCTRYPNGYCGLGGTGVSCPVGLTSSTPEPPAKAV